MMAGPKFFDQTTFSLLAAAGIPLERPLEKVALAQANGGEGANLQQGILRVLDIIDRQDAINRFSVENCYYGIDPKMFMRILYYRGQLMLFPWQGKHYCLPYALDGNIDEYGRYLSVTPIIFTGASDGKDKPWIDGVSFTPVYEAPRLSDFADKSADEIEYFINHSCVLIHDYSPGLSQQIVPRNLINKPILDVMSVMIPFARTALLNATGISGVPVDAGQEATLEAASAGVTLAALEGRKYVPISRGTMADMQELTGGQVAKAEEFFLAMQSLDNFRLSTYGIENGGIFKKKAHTLQAEQDLNGGAVGLVHEDSLREIQKALTIYNTIHGGSMWIEPAESAVGADLNGDMVEGDDGPDAMNRPGGGEGDE